MDPFAVALDVLFAAPGSIPATYVRIETGVASSIRVIRSVQDADPPFGGGSVIVDAAIFEVKRSDVDRPERGDTIQIGDDLFVLAGEPRLDVEGVTWRCEAPPVA